MHLIGWLSSLLSCIISGALICSFIWVIFFLSWSAYYVKEWGLRYFPGWGNPPRCLVMLDVGEGSKREQWCLLHSAVFQSLPLPLLPTIKLGPSGADSRVGGFVYALGPCESLQWTPMRLGVSPTTTTPTDFYSLRFWGFISLHWNPGFCGLSQSPGVPPGLYACKCGTTWATHCCLAHPGPPAATSLCILSTLVACLHSSYWSGWMFLL